MSIQRTKLSLRAFMIVAALISLCVSSNVGPRFLPLPALSDDPATTQSEPRGESASRQTYCEADDFRVPMMSQTHKRTDREPQQPQGAALLLKDAFISLNDCRVAIELHYANFLPEPPASSASFGRAPPDYV